MQYINSHALDNMVAVSDYTDYSNHKFDQLQYDSSNRLHDKKKQEKKKKKKTLRRFFTHLRTTSEENPMGRIASSAACILVKPTCKTKSPRAKIGFFVKFKHEFLTRNSSKKRKTEISGLGENL